MGFSVIQGGMGVGVSGYRLAREVSLAGQLGVVSGTGLDVMLARRLADGDPSGDLRRALAHYPVPAATDRVLKRYFRSERPSGTAYPTVPMFTIEPSMALEELNVMANFVEVFLAKEGHASPVGINYLTKIQMHTPSALYGAMLAGVDYVVMGAGIPAHIPSLLDELAMNHDVAMRVNVDDSNSDDHYVRFDPRRHGFVDSPALHRPEFLAIVASHTLATFLARDAATRPDGFVVEGPSAGGHNAPPRGTMTLDDSGQPVYGGRDEPNLRKISELGLPFWLAGGQADPAALQSALAAGAQGVQVGTAFALCEASGLAPAYRHQLLLQARHESVEVFTDPKASPSGYPFKVASVPGTLSEDEEYALRPRRCDLGYLRSAFERPDGSIGYRCPSEPVDHYVRKGGDAADTDGRKCLCNALMANVGLAQVRSNGSEELPLITVGDDVVRLGRVLQRENGTFTARDVLAYLFQNEPTGVV
jgi:NAD(P)H-dependent flavin oxidoreductase YrpB (nitropropane dioxygenase family)